MTGNTYFFDLETRHTFEEVHPGYDALGWREKEDLRPKLISKLGFATGVLIDRKTGVALTFDEGDEKKLLKTLDDSAAIIGHNLLRFDYGVLASSVKIDVTERYRERTIDTWQQLNDATRRFISLDDLAICNGLKIRKTLKGSDAPKLWRDGKKDVVREYCKNDVVILKQVYEIGVKNGAVVCSIPDSTGIKKPTKVKVDWDVKMLVKQ